MVLQNSNQTEPQSVDTSIKLPYKVDMTPYQDEVYEDPVFISKTEMEQLDDSKVASFDIWCENFYQNWHTLRKGKDIKELFAKCNKSQPAVVVGAGPAIWDNNHLDLLKDFKYRDNLFIIATNKMLLPLIERDIIPDIVACSDGHRVTMDSFKEALRKYPEICKKIPAVFVHSTYHGTIKMWKEYNRYFVNLFMGQMSTRIINKFAPHTTIKTAGDVGSLCWQIANFCNKDPICIIGMDFGYKDPKDNYAFRQYQWEREEGMIAGYSDDEMAQRFFRKDKNPYTGSVSYLESVFEGYRVAFLSFALMSPATTFNCSERGAIWDKGNIIKNIPFRSFLKRMGKIYENYC